MRVPRALQSDPDACISLDALSREPELRDRVDQRALHLPQIPVQVLAVSLEIDDRVAHELARTVERDVTASLDLEQLDAPGCEEIGRRDQVCTLGSPPERDDRRMLDKEQYVLVDFAGDTTSGNLALQLECVPIRQKAEIDDQQLVHGASGVCVRRGSSALTSRARPRPLLPTASGERELPGRLPRP